jgi:hypothetical protein
VGKFGLELRRCNGGDYNDIFNGLPCPAVFNGPGFPTLTITFRGHFGSQKYEGSRARMGRLPFWQKFISALFIYKNVRWIGGKAAWHRSLVTPLQ